MVYTQETAAYLEKIQSLSFEMGTALTVIMTLLFSLQVTRPVHLYHLPPCLSSNNW